MRNYLNQTLIRCADIFFSSLIILILLPSIAFAVCKSIFQRERILFKYVTRDVLDRPVAVLRVNNASDNVGALVSVWLGKLSLCGIPLVDVDGNSEQLTYPELSHYPVMPGVISIHDVHSGTGLVEQDRHLVFEEHIANFSIGQYVSLLVKGVLVRALYTNTTLTVLPEITLHGLHIGNHTMESAVDWALKRSKTTKTGVFVNVNSINLSFVSSGLFNDINSSDRVFADGSGVRLAAKHHGVRLLDNVNGTDMLPCLCHAASQKGRSIFLLGAEPGVAASAARNLQTRFPGLTIAGTHHGYFDKRSTECDGIVEKINNSGADILLVALGSPMQEAWLTENREKLTVSTALAVGGLFDFFSGNIMRAPCWIREIGMEWVWRLIQEPSAKWKRYVIGNPLFMLRLYFAKHSTPCVSHRSRANVALANKAVASGIPLFLQQLAIFPLLIFLSPIFVATLIAIKLESRGPALFTQTRVGENGKRFKLYKFRSMYMKSDPRYVEPDAGTSDRDGVCKKYFDDPRITRVGKFIRRFSIDELPQLMNVATGEMVLIGPRPALPHEVNAYDLEMYRRLDSKPGLTGLWQVSGRANTTFDEQISLDLAYIDKRSLWLDLRIILATFLVVLKGEGAY